MDNNSMNDIAILRAADTVRHPHRSGSRRPQTRAAAALLAAGRPVIISAAGQTALVLGAATITAASVADLIRHSSGFVQVALTRRRCDTLLIPAAATINPGASGAAGQCVAVDAARGITTGISAADRAHTIRLLCDPATTPDDLTRPGHVVPVRADLPDPWVPEPLPANLGLDLSVAALPIPGVAYAELTSERDPLHPIRIDEAHLLARRMGTIVVSG